jgi:hypothetical protein
MAVQTVTVIKQADLQRIHELQGGITDMQSTLDKLVDEVKQQLFARTPIERGRFDARLNWIASHNVPWKQIVIEQLGQSYAEEVRKGTPTVKRCELKVIEHAIPPLWKQLHLESETLGG